VAGEHAGPDGDGRLRGGPSLDGWSCGSERRFAAAASFCSRCAAAECRFAAAASFFAMLEAERRWTGNQTETLTADAIKLSKRKKIATILGRTQTLFSFFLSWVSKTQPNHWTKQMANARLAS